MSSTVRPCRGCTERYAGCHGHCEKEAEWMAKTEPGRVRERQHREKERFFTAFIQNGKQRYLRHVEGGEKTDGEGLCGMWTGLSDGIQQKDHLL